MSEQSDLEQNPQENGKLPLLYDKLATKAKEAFSESSEKTVAALEAAIEKSRHHLEQAGELSRRRSARTVVSDAVQQHAVRVDLATEGDSTLQARLHDLVSIEA